ncbi:MAG: glycosyltransferase family 4 protein [bacterium]|nr:glycosyltransferase family 4 protein [bacterium]
MNWHLASGYFMRIAHVCPRYYPAMGGAEEVIKNYAEGMAARGHEVAVFCSDEDVKSSAEEVLNGVKVVRCHSYPLKLFHSYSLYPSILRKLMQFKPDLIHTHGTRYFASDVGAIAAKVLRKPLVFNPYAGQFLTTKLGKVHQKIVGWLSFRADAVITISQYEKDLVEKGGVHPKRWVHLPVGIDPRPYDDVEENVYERFGLTWEPIILSLGRLVPHKGLDTLLKAAPAVLEKFAQTRFFIAGQDYGMRLELAALAEKLGITKSVIFSGGLSEEDKYSAFKNATVFCLPSRSEAFGVVLIEAMAARLPTVGTNWMSIPEIIDDGQTGYLFPLDDHESLASRLIELLGDDLLRRRMGEAGRQKVEEKYSWPKILDKLESLYLELK